MNNRLIECLLLVLVANLLIRGLYFYRKKRLKLELEIMDRQFEINQRIFGEFDFEKYSFWDLKKINEELKDLQRLKKVSLGELRWFEILKPSTKVNRLSQKREDRYIELDEVKSVSSVLNWDITLLGENKESLDELRSQSRKEVEELRNKINTYFMECFKKNIVKVFNSRFNWLEVEFFVEFAIERGLIERESLEKEISKLLGYKVVKVRVEKNSIKITIPTDTKVNLEGLPMFAKFVNDYKGDHTLTAMAGANKEGEVVEYDLSKTGGVLISGSCGTGKTTLIKQLVASIMLTKSPDEVKFLFCDSHGIEYDMFEGSPYLYKSIKRNKKEVFDALKDLEKETQRRLELFSSGGFKNIGELNNKVSEADRLPYIVVVIDYEGMFLENGRGDKEELLTNLIYKGRSVGIVYVQTYQSVRADYISRRLKDSFALSFIFNTNSAIESQIAIGNSSVSYLPTRGVCLAKSNDNPEPIRVYTINITDKEMEQITESASRA